MKKLTSPEYNGGTRGSGQVTQCTLAYIEPIIDDTSLIRSHERAYLLAVVSSTTFIVDAKQSSRLIVCSLKARSAWYRIVFVTSLEAYSRSPEYRIPAGSSGNDANGSGSGCEQGLRPRSNRRERTNRPDNAMGFNVREPSVNGKAFCLLMNDVKGAERGSHILKVLEFDADKSDLVFILTTLKVGPATPVMLDSTWRKIEYRLDVLRGFEMGLCAKVIKSSTQLKSLD
ncbi:hypothetical protein HZH66_000891 [Vespula vulgaris]|uniref:Uncharacterized protein n=1 Tax=Vespula vulgaris TaxID=7454 RepID=A0A834NK61_VESVU|nr:hypothetical protein HZH66_000891 [Vespula vulgaris]